MHSFASSVVLMKRSVIRSFVHFYFLSFILSLTSPIFRFFSFRSFLFSFFQSFFCLSNHTFTLQLILCQSNFFNLFSIIGWGEYASPQQRRGRSRHGNRAQNVGRFQRASRSSRHPRFAREAPGIPRRRSLSRRPVIRWGILPRDDSIYLTKTDFVTRPPQSRVIGQKQWWPSELRPQVLKFY